MVGRLFALVFIGCFFLTANAQVNVNAKSNEFYMTPWLIDFADTIKIYDDNKLIASNTKYTFVRKIKGKQYKAFLWKDKGSNEAARYVDEKLKIKFKSKHFIIKLGKIKHKYFINRRNNNSLTLIKQRKK